MAQHDYVIDNQSGSSFRSDLNNNLSAIVTTNSGSSAPSTTYAYMMWADTSNNLLKRRNGANNAWQIVGDLTGDYMVMDTSKRVGFGTDTPGDYNADYDNVVIYQSSGNAGLTIATGTSGTGGIAFADGTSGNAEYRGYIDYDHANDRMQIGIQGGLRVQYGGQGASFINANNGDTLTVRSTSGSSATYILVHGLYSSAADMSGGSDAFLIRTNGNFESASNSYGPISSDERLKQDIVDAPSQWDDIKNIQLKKYRYKNNPDGQLQLGVIAQELEQVCPNLVTHRPATALEVAESGNLIAEGDDVLSFKASILYMKSVKALQEAMARIEELEAKVAALEAA
jgi:hypothetical protein